MADLADDQWIVGYLSAEVSKSRTTLECDRDAQMERLRVCFLKQTEFLQRGEVELGAGRWHLLPHVSEARRAHFVHALTLFLEEEENLSRYKLEVVFEQEMRRLILVHRSTHRAAGELLSLSFRV